MKKILSVPFLQISVISLLVLGSFHYSLADCITNPPTVNAGADAFTQGCTIPPPVALNGSVGGSATGGIWSTSGTGTFSNNTSLNATYFPSSNDRFSPSITLTLTTTGGGCTPVSDDLILSFVLYTPNAYSGPNQTVCSNVSFVQLAGTSIASTHTWSTKGTGTGTFTPNNTTLNAKYIPSAADITNGSVQLTLMPSGDPCNFALPMTVTFFKVATSPSSPTICENGSTTFATTVSAGYAGTVSYQWQVDKGSGFANATDLTNEYTGSATATLTLKANVATNTYNNYKYRAVVSACSTTYNSNAATLTIKSNTLTITDPSDQSVCAGSTAIFNASIAPNASGVTYRWSQDQGLGGGFVNLNNTATITGALTNSLTLSNVSAAMSNYKYKLTATNGCTTQSSNAKTLSITNLTFSSQPQPATICANDSTGFAAAVSGDVVSSYQWQVDQGSGFVDVANNSMYSGATTNTLSVKGVVGTMNGYNYQCVVKSTCSPAGKTSSSALLTVNSSVSIGSSPTLQEVCEGSPATFSVTASGATSYNWQVNDGSGYMTISDNATYSNSHSASLTVNTTLALDGYSYRAFVQSAGCTTTINSAAAILHVNSAALSISAQPEAISSCEGSDVSFFVTSVGSSVTYHWQADAGAGFIDLMEGGTYANVTSASLSVSSLAVPMNGTKYRVVVSTACSSITSSEVLLTVIAAPVVTAQPSDAVVWNEGGITFVCAASGAHLTYQWQAKGISDVAFSNLIDGSVYSNTATNTLSLANTSASLDGTSYRCVIGSTDCGSMTAVTNTATLSLQSIAVCMVTTDETTGKNVIVFEKPADLIVVDSFLVYRLNTSSNHYELISRLYKNELSTFVDGDADPALTSYVYQVAVLDVHHHTFPVSSSTQRSIHLNVTQGSGLDLVWNTYDDNTSNSYNIYRGVSADALSLLTSVSGNASTFTDSDAPVGLVFYQIELQLTASCNPTARTSAYTSVKSNKVEATNVITENQQSLVLNNLTLYPNPANDVVVLNGLPEEQSVITVVDLSGSILKTVTSEKSTFSLSIDELAKGMYLIEVQNSLGRSRRSLLVQ